MRVVLRGPYPNRAGWRMRLVFLNSEGKESRRAWALTGETREEAERIGQLAQRAASTEGEPTVSECLAEYKTHQLAHGKKETSIATTMFRLRKLFKPALDDEMNALTAPRATRLFEQLFQQSVDTQRNTLAEAKTFLNWCVEQRWIHKNPLAAVQAKGKRKHGKPQHRIDEARKLRLVCHQRAALGDDGAVAVLIGLLMGLRAGEIISRTVRDVDDGGRLLWIPDAKTPAGKRTVQVWPELQPYLLARCHGRHPDDVLFPGGGKGGKHWRDWPREETERLCKEAGVPIICAHALRGFAATLGVVSQIPLEQLAAALGHVSSTTTLQSYAAPGSQAQAQQEHAIGVLDRKDEPKQDSAIQVVDLGHAEVAIGQPRFLN